MAGPSRTAVHIFLDTNALFTEAADRLIAVDLSEFISKSFDNDPKPQWYIPAVVTGERRFQMIERANRLLPQLDKVEKLLGHNLGITGDVLSTRVDEAIKRQIDAHNLHEVGFDQSLVDWQEMVRRSVLRQPPFGTGESEKGFRDAVVLETFCQIVSELPKSSQACRVVLLSNDERLVEAAQERMAERSNVTFARDLDTVKTILNALASEITQDAVNELLPHASDLFFKVDEKKALYYSAEVGEKIRSTFGDVLKKIPQDSDNTSTKIINITSPPTFLVKEGQRLTFSSRVIFRMEAIKYIPRPTTERAPSPAGLAGLIGITQPALSTTSVSTGSPLSSGLNFSGLGVNPSFLGSLAPQYDEVKREGEIIFEVRWSATLTARGKLTRPQILKIEYKATNWKE
jgi:hypothetical protein